MTDFSRFEELLRVPLVLFTASLIYLFNRSILSAHFLRYPPYGQLFVKTSKLMTYVQFISLSWNAHLI
jgi:hypothetical protein